MRFSGRVYKDEGFWLAEIPILDAMTQGHTKNEAFEMAVDMVESMVSKKDFQVELFKGKNGGMVGAGSLLIGRMSRFFSGS